MSNLKLQKDTPTFNISKIDKMVNKSNKDLCLLWIPVVLLLTLSRPGGLAGVFSSGRSASFVFVGYVSSASQRSESLTLLGRYSNSFDGNNFASISARSLALIRLCIFGELDGLRRWLRLCSSSVSASVVPISNCDLRGAVRDLALEAGLAWRFLLVS